MISAERHAHAELLSPLTYLIRVFAVGRRFGDPYDLSVIAQCHEPGRAEIKGLEEKMLPSHWRAIRECLLDLGINEVSYQRRRADGRVDTRVKQLRRRKTA